MLPDPTQSVSTRRSEDFSSIARDTCFHTPAPSSSTSLWHIPNHHRPPCDLVPAGLVDRLVRRHAAAERRRQGLTGAVPLHFRIETSLTREGVTLRVLSVLRCCGAGWTNVHRAALTVQTLRHLGLEAEWYWPWSQGVARGLGHHERRPVLRHSRPSGLQGPPASCMLLACSHLRFRLLVRDPHGKV